MTAKTKPHLAKAAVGALLAIAMTTAASATSEGWITDLAAAKKQAAESNRDIFMNFTGSDW